MMLWKVRASLKTADPVGCFHSAVVCRNQIGLYTDKQVVQSLLMDKSSEQSRSHHKLLELLRHSLLPSGLFGGFFLLQTSQGAYNWAQKFSEEKKKPRSQAFGMPRHYWIPSQTLLNDGRLSPRISPTCSSRCTNTCRWRNTSGPIGGDFPSPLPDCGWTGSAGARRAAPRFHAD